MHIVLRQLHRRRHHNSCEVANIEVRPVEIHAGKVWRHEAEQLTDVGEMAAFPRRDFGALASSIPNREVLRAASRWSWYALLYDDWCSHLLITAYLNWVVWVFHVCHVARYAVAVNFHARSVPQTPTPHHALEG